MPAFSTIALGVASAASVAGGIYKAEQGRRDKEKAQRDIDNYQRQELTNVYEGLSVPMESFDMRRQQLQQDLANQSDLLGMAGARGVVGGIQALQSYSQQGLRQIGADLEQSQFKLQSMIAQDELRIQEMREQREQQDLIGLGAQYEAGRQTQMSGIGDAIQGGIGLATVTGSIPANTPTSRVGGIGYGGSSGTPMQGGVSVGGQTRIIGNPSILNQTGHPDPTRQIDLYPSSFRRM